MPNDESVTGSYNPTNNSGTIVQIPIPSGELWYVDQLSVVSDGGGSRTGLQRTTLAVDQPASFANASRNVVPRSTTPTVEPDDEDGATGVVGAYGTGGEEIRIVGDRTNDPVTVTFTAIIRRIL
jgi:hypothetical protein